MNNHTWICCYCGGFNAVAVNKKVEQEIYKDCTCDHCNEVNTLTIRTNMNVGIIENPKELKKFVE